MGEDGIRVLGRPSRRLVACPRLVWRAQVRVGSGFGVRFRVPSGDTLISNLLIIFLNSAVFDHMFVLSFHRFRRFKPILLLALLKSPLMSIFMQKTTHYAT